MRRAGIIVNGIEFIPADIVDQHTPFAVPPSMTVEYVWVLTNEELDWLNCPEHRP